MEYSREVDRMNWNHRKCGEAAKETHMSTIQKLYGAIASQFECVGGRGDAEYYEEWYGENEPYKAQFRFVFFNNKPVSVQVVGTIEDIFDN